jgi:hypothetical protein
VLHGSARLHQPNRKQAEDHPQQQADVDGPEGKGERAVLPGLARPQRAEAEEHQSNFQHATHTEQSRVGVDRRGIEPLHVIESHGRIDQESEQPGANEVLEANGHEVVGHLYAATQNVPLSFDLTNRMFSHASKPMSTGGTASRALNVAPSARTMLGVLEK